MPRPSPALAQFVPHAVRSTVQSDKGSPMELTTAQVAEKLGVTPRRVRALITSGRLKAKKIGRDYLIDSRDLARFTPRPPGNLTGRPRHRAGRPRRAADPEA